ncbi:hypothetical protein D9758_002159 [Tetrapyrgos nigripes]|uniref:Intradiol ring-cleavage dioxygenases domain-containing protein n=1 Tax=Tetrapyrgos nigripes TaxID=182062 RepID=A0A8H5LT46_9AGAR|nr:hypothetical protein D9758_002159 [Tetrapyrgos nigripes]
MGSSEKRPPLHLLANDAAYYSACACHREWHHLAAAGHDASQTIQAREYVKRSFYAQMLNEDCAPAPSVDRVNYIIVNGTRQDIADGQPGVQFVLDVGIIDTSTCQPLTGVLAEVWHANATGDYDDSSLRGAAVSGENGIVEFQTIFPGFTSEGANHINIAIHSGNTMDSTIVYTGRVFFTDFWTDVISKADNYTGNTHQRILNADDPNFTTASGSGFNPVVDVVSIEDDWPAGVIGYITVAIA